MIVYFTGQASRRLLSVTTCCLVAFGFAVGVFTATEPQRPDETPLHSIPQNAPCPDQPKSLTELTKAFNEGRIPSTSEMTGTWVAISGFVADYEKSLNCSGLKRGAKLYEQVIVAKGYSLETHFIGTGVRMPATMPDKTSSLSFPFDFGGDASPVFRCRLTARKTVACLIDVYRQGVEFKKASVRPDEMVQNSVPR